MMFTPEPELNFFKIWIWIRPFRSTNPDPTKTTGYAPLYLIFTGCLRDVLLPSRYEPPGNDSVQEYLVKKCITKNYFLLTFIFLKLCIYNYIYFYLIFIWIREGF